ncbi:helix-turn-helix transcriptional regulator [Streptomyces sp. CBMA152]|uniref:helix-turn-helix domain-containing protein n=1 Tax=Streptomyces sp. CBMA152 TaxID=1896312 RepID=UPI001660483E|nr:helix-turn-helix transcriptional regulator [Streptomyces sp. CBMA152]MBD0743486.1 hypothetical protein [Streptomyces sp. CBMA152]
MGSPHDEAALQRLAAAVRQRRVQLKMSKIDVARAADVTITTYGKIERGESVRDVTYGKVEPVLQWADGSCRDILDGASAMPVAPSPVAGAVYAEIDEATLEEDFVESLRSAVIAVSDDTTTADIRKLTEAALEEWKRRRAANPGITDTN